MRLDPVRFKHTEHVNNDWTLTVEAEVKLDDILRPEFLSNIANQLRPYDRIRVRIDTGEWYAELMVLSAGRTWAKTILLMSKSLVTQDVEITQTDALDSEEYLIQHRGPHLKFCVIRKSDKQPIKEQIESKADAQRFLAEYVRT